MTSALAPEILDPIDVVFLVSEVFQAINSGVMKIINIDDTLRAAFIDAVGEGNFIELVRGGGDKLKDSVMWQAALVRKHI